MYRFLLAGGFLVTCLASSGGFWPHYSGRREVTSLDGVWSFGFDGSKDFDVLQKDQSQDPQVVGTCSRSQGFAVGLGAVFVMLLLD